MVAELTPGPEGQWFKYLNYQAGKVDETQHLPH